MEKRKPHYSLAGIKAQMTTIRSMNFTLTASLGIKAMGMSAADALKVVQNLTMADFYKSMTAHAASDVWQDVYHAEWRGKGLYIKFQKEDEYFVISFKER